MSSILTNNGAMIALQTLNSINKNLATTQNEISTGKNIAAITFSICSVGKIESFFSDHNFRVSKPAIFGIIHNRNRFPKIRAPQMRQRLVVVAEIIIQFIVGIRVRPHRIEFGLQE